MFAKRALRQATRKVARNRSPTIRIRDRVTQFTLLFTIVILALGTVLFSFVSVVLFPPAGVQHIRESLPGLHSEDSNARREKTTNSLRIQKLSHEQNPIIERASKAEISSSEFPVEKQENHEIMLPSCDVTSISSALDLVNQKVHIVEPPPGPITLVCCQTTAGPLSIVIHPNWAPLGSSRFLSMVKSWYFSSKVPMFRCVKNFICQFGLAGDPDLNK